MKNAARLFVAIALAMPGAHSIAGYMQMDPIGLNGGLNRTGYAAGNPMSAIDPWGLACVALSGVVTCTSPGGPTVQFPQPRGWPSSMKPGDPNYHFYDKSRPAQGADPKCVADYLRNRPTPGNPKPATTQGTPNDATPGWASLFATSPVHSYVASHNGTQVVVNVTQPSL